MTDAPTGDGCDGYLALLENLTPESLSRLGDFVTSDIRFSDPFNATIGIVAYRNVLEDMFRRVAAPKFRIDGKARSGRHLFLHWTFSGRAPLLGKWEFSGMSLIQLTESGLVESHEDYWDSGRSVFGALPIIGPVIRLLSKRITAPARPVS